MPRLTEAFVQCRARPKKGSRYTLHQCSDLKGFYVRAMASGERSYLVMKTIASSGGQRPQVVIGKALPAPGGLSANVAREIAVKAIAMADAGDDYRALFGKEIMEQATGLKSEPFPIPHKVVRTLDDLFDHWVNEGHPVMKRGGGVRQPSTNGRDVSRYETHLRGSLLGKARLEKIDDQKVESFMQSIAEIEVVDGRAIDRNAGARTHVLTLAKSLTNWGRRRKFKVGLIELVPRKSRKRKDHYPLAQLKLMRKTFQAENKKALAKGDVARTRRLVAMALFLEVGARPGDEIFTARWGWLRETVEGVPHLLLPRDKTHAHEIELILTRKALALLDTLPRGADGDYIFPSAKSKSGHFETVQKPWNAFFALPAIKAARIPRFPPYALRHSVSTALDKIGIPRSVAKLALRHADDGVHASYTHADLREAYAALERYSSAIDRA